MRTVLLFCLVLPGLLALSLAAGAQTIFSDLTTNGGWALPPLNGQIGEEVTVAGANWQVTSLSIEIYSQNGIFPAGTPGFADFQASLYANNGALGAPGTLLWQSALVPDNYPGGLSLLTFAVPDVAVPDQFTWTLYYTNDNPEIPPSVPVANAPTIGTYDTGWFTPSSPDWTRVATDGGDGYMAQIIAVPEPGAGILLTAGALALGILTARVRSHAICIGLSTHLG
jgi:hypothetical protein